MCMNGIFVGHPKGAMNAQRLAGDVVVDLGHGHLDGGDVLSDLVVVLVLVDQPGGAQNHEAELLELNPALCDLLLHHLIVSDPPVAGGPVYGSLAHQIHGVRAGADRAHGVVDPPASETAVTNDEGLPPGPEQGVLADPDVVVSNIAFRAVVGPKADVPQDLHPLVLVGTMNMDMRL